MTVFILLSIALVALAGALLTRQVWWPLLGIVPGANDKVRLLAAQLKQLRGLHDSGVLGDAQFAEGKSAIELKLLDAVAPSADAHEEAPRPSLRLTGVALVFVVLLAGAGYQLVGAPDHLALGPQSSAGAVSTMAGDADQDANTAARPVTAQQIQAMVDGLAERLKANPGDGNGWVMLARSYVALGKHADAAGAFKRAQTLRPDDADLLADYADALAMVNSGLQGEPLAMVERAIKLDPRNVKALSLAGTAAFDNKDYAGAVKMWERAALVEPPGSAFSQQLRSGIAEARQLAGLPPSTVVTADAPPAAAAAFTAGAAQVTGTVTLARDLATRVSPDDTVFIFARAVEGQRMPLAIVRKQVKDLPFRFTLDDSMSMSPEAKLSGFARVVVGARISKSGNALPQSGDFSGRSAPVKPGAAGVKVTIDQVVP